MAVAVVHLKTCALCTQIDNRIKVEVRIKSQYDGNKQSSDRS